MQVATIGQAWSWWTKELREVAAIARATFGLPPPMRSYISVDESGVGFWKVSDASSKLVELEQAPAAGRDDKVTGLLNANQVITRKISLPKSARSDLREAVQYQIGTYTPFAAKDVVFDYHVLADARDGNAITVEMIVVPVSVIDRFRDAVAVSNLQLDALEMRQPIATDSKATFRIPLGAPYKRDLTRPGPLLALCGVLILCLIATIIWREGQYRDRLADEYEALRPAIAQAQSFKKDVAELTSLRESFGKSLSQSTRVLPALEELSAVLDDDSYLVEFRLTDERMEIAGLTKSAASVLAKIEASPMFSDARFSAPILRQAEDALERFSITAGMEAPK